MSASDPVNHLLSRRELLLGAGAGWLLGPGRARAAGAPTTRELLAEIEAASAALGEARIDGLDWRSRISAALATVDPKQVRADLTVDWSSVLATARTEGRWERRLEIGELRGTPSEPHFRRKLVCLRRDHAVIPHAHRHIVSVFVVLDGQARGRHFDRLADEPDAILIRPSEDRVLAPGDHAEICDQADNIHWFTAVDDAVMLLNFSATVPSSLRIQSGSAGRVYLDPDGEPLDDGVIRAPRVGSARLRAKYDGTGL